LINNAGLGIYGEFLDIPWERERAMLELDILVVVHLTKLFARDMAERGAGYILQIASIGAYQPSPTYATYSAAKSFILYFSEALHYELKPKGIVCTVLSPGTTQTEFLQVAGQEPTLYQRVMMMDSATVANTGIEAMLKGKSHVMPGIVNNVLALSNRFVPRQWGAAIAHRFMR
jgi:short-subunit dehydrogenase